MARYVHQRGDLIALTFDPRSAHEQKGGRPALVVSHDLLNKRTGFAIVCPITTRTPGFPFHVQVTGSSKATGFVMVEQVSSVDFWARGAKRIAKAPQPVLDEVLPTLEACVYSAPPSDESPRRVRLAVYFGVAPVFYKDDNRGTGSLVAQAVSA